MTEQARPVRHQGLYDWMQSMVFAILALVCLLTFAGRYIGVRDISMTPTLVEGDRMIVQHMFYTPERGDVVIFSRQGLRDGVAMVKRVIAVGGDVIYIDVEAGRVYVNDAPLDEPYIYEAMWWTGDMIYPYTVAEGRVFLVGDNRNRSLDSRSTEVGTVDEREILGRVIAVVFPLNRMQIFSR